MPELPEVEGFRKYVHGTSLEQKIKAVVVKDSKVLNYGVNEFQEALVGRRFVDTDRIGKYMFILLDQGPALMLHYGMTGSPVYYREADEAPRHDRVTFAFENGFQLAFNCPRKFGRITLSESVEAYAEAHKIGPDAAKISRNEFHLRMKGRKTFVKAALLNQAILAGVGNWIVDEVLYQAALHPEERVNELSEKDLDLIYDQLQYVVGTALKLEAHMPDFPKSFLTHSRWTDKGRPDAPMLDLEIIRVGGRSTYFDPKVQVKR